jgi:hypothetical protein
MKEASVATLNAWAVRGPTVDRDGLTEADAWHIFLGAGPDAVLFYLDKWMAHRQTPTRANGAIAMAPYKERQ